MRRMADGDERALELLYATYGATLFNYLLRLVHEWEIAEDILQEAFLGAWKNARRFRDDCSVKTWLIRIAHHRAVDWLRAQRPTVSIDETTFEIPDERSADAFEMVGTIDQIQQALAHLSANHRAVIELTFVQGLSYWEIAQVMNCPVGTVKSRMSYALSYLKRTLNNLNVCA